MNCHDSLISQYVTNLKRVLDDLDRGVLSLLANHLKQLIAAEKTLYICGNGGSAANAMHLANDFTYGINPAGKAMSVEALSSNSSVVTCLGNDIGYENIFSHQLKVKGRSGDMLLVLSGSGNSPNIINAIKQAKCNGMICAGVLGFEGGQAKELLDLVLHFPVQDMQISEDTQIVIGHLLMKILYEELADG